MHALNMRAAHVTLHASMHVTSGIMCLLTLCECWHCTDHCIVWPLVIHVDYAHMQIAECSSVQHICNMHR